MKQSSSKNKSLAPDPIANADHTIDAIETLIGAMSLRGALDPVTRKEIRSRVATYPTAIIESLAVASSRNNGVILGTTFDAAEARKAVTYVNAQSSVATALRRAAQLVEDDALQVMGDLVSRAQGIYALMQRAIPTSEGKAWGPTFGELQDAHKSARKRTRRNNAAASATTPTAQVASQVSTSTADTVSTAPK